MKKQELKDIIKQMVIEVLNESSKKKWITGKDGAIKKPGQLHKDLGVPAGEKIPHDKLVAASKKSGKVGQRARLALTLAKLRKKKK